MKGPILSSTTLNMAATLMMMSAFLQLGGVLGVNFDTIKEVVEVDLSDGAEPIQHTDAELRAFQLRADAAHERLWSRFNGSAASFSSLNTDTTDRESGESVLGSCINHRWMDFTNKQNPPGFHQEYGSSIAEGIGLLLACNVNGDGTRMYYDNNIRYSPYLFNTDAQRETHLMVWVTGSRGNGMNSNTYLIQEAASSSGSDDPRHGVQDGTRDEIDLFEMYGYSGIAEYNIFRNGGMAGPWNHNVNQPGYNDYMYELFLIKGSYMKIWCRTSGPPDKSTTLSVKEFSGGVVPSNPMRLYAGIWDCQRDCPGCGASKCGGESPQYDSYMTLKGLYLHNC